MARIRREVMERVGGGTCLYDAIEKGITEACKDGKGLQRELVILTDGEDSDDAASRRVTNKLATLDRTHPGLHVVMIGVGEDNDYGGYGGYGGGVDQLKQFCKHKWTTYQKCGDASDDIRKLFKTVQTSIEGRYARMCRKLKDQTGNQAGFSDVKPTGKDTDPLNAMELAVYEYLLFAEKSSRQKGYTGQAGRYSGQWRR